MRAGVIAADRVAAVAIDDGIHAVAHGERLLEQRLVRAHTLHRQHAAGDLRDRRVPVREVNKPVSPTCPPESP